jgi:aminoglycoside phosphotransferase (APT) family kinase protein
MMKDVNTPHAGPLDHIIQDAKAQFAGVEPKRLQQFIASQDDVIGEVTLGDISYLTGGAGASNGIAFVDATLDRGDGKRRYELVVRYVPPFDGFFVQKALRHEFLTIRAARSAGIAAPDALWIDADGSILGFPSFIMKRIHGDAPAVSMYSKGPLANVSDAERKAMMLQAAEFHGHLKKASIGAEQVPHLLERGTGVTAMERELNWWLEEAKCRLSPTDAKLKRLTSIYEWLLLNQPQLPPPVLVHGDAQIANFIYREKIIVAAIDWELASLGYNESDLACLIFLTSLLKKLDLDVGGTPTPEEYIERFEEASGSRVLEWDYFMLFNQWRAAVSGALAGRLAPDYQAMWHLYDNPIEELWARARASAAALD